MISSVCDAEAPRGLKPTLLCLIAHNSWTAPVRSFA